MLFVLKQEKPSICIFYIVSEGSVKNENGGLISLVATSQIFGQIIRSLFLAIVILGTMK